MEDSVPCTFPRGHWDAESAKERSGWTQRSSLFLLSAKIAAGISAPVKTGELHGAGQADVFGEELEEEGYFWWVVLPPSF